MAGTSEFTNVARLGWHRRGFFAGQTAYVTLAFVIICFLAALFSGNFATTGNLLNISGNFSYIALMSLGMTVVIITGGIDLSVGSVCALVAVCSMIVMRGVTNSPLVAVPYATVILTIIAGLLLAAATGLINGLLIAVLELSHSSSLQYSSTSCVSYNQNSTIRSREKTNMRLTRLLLIAAAIAIAGGHAFAADKKMRFAVVPKAMNNPYFDLSRDGCMARAKALGNVECIYTGPIEHEPASQVQIIQDLVTQGVDGLAISVSDAEAAIGVIKQARDTGIAVITFDADSPKSARHPTSEPTTRRWAPN